MSRFDTDDERLKFDDRLKNWITNTISGVEVSLDIPELHKSGRGIGLYLLELLQSPPPSTGTPPPLQIILKYVVTAWADKIEDAHQILLRLMLSAMESAEYQVDLESLPVQSWTALGVPPQPSFVLRVPLRQERQQRKRVLVRERLQVNWDAGVRLFGVVQGPGQVTLPNCRVEIPALSLSTDTDHEGRFCFPNVPGGKKELVVKARGRRVLVQSENDHTSSSDPLVIHFSPWEE